MNRHQLRAAVVLPYFGNGGAEHMVADIVSAIDMQRVELRVFCVYGSGQGNDMESRIAAKGVAIEYIGKGKGFSPAALARLYHSLSRYDPDVVHTHLYSCVYVLPWIFTHRVHMLHTFHNIPEIENRRAVRRWLMRFAIRIGKVTPVAISDENQGLLMKYYRLQAESVPVVKNPVRIAKFRTAERAVHAPIRFVTLGRLSPQKNHRLMLHAFRAALDRGISATLLIAGDGELKEELLSELRELELVDAVSLVGYIENVAPLLASSDVFVLSSNYEGLPISALEAMASGLPIISTDVGGMRDLISGNGILVPKEDCHALSGAMVRLAQDHELRLAMGQCSERLVQPYSDDTAAEHYLALYQKYAVHRMRGDRNAT